ncbi:MAG: AraC family transcriptional regulator [Spirochaetes bacterium]|nr:AraC family transcriptional regulator [Spirochaetota bacterium]
MPQLLLTQYSYERIVLVILVGALLFVLFTRKKKSVAKKYLAAYFIFVILFNIGHLITYSILVPAGAYGWYLAALAPFGLVCLVQFAYHFPQRLFVRESRIVHAIAVVVSLLAFFDYLYGAYRSPIHLAETGYGSQYESPWIPPLAAMLFLWTWIVFVRQAIRIEKFSGRNKTSLWKLLWIPKNPDARKARNFALVVLFEFINTLTIALYMSLRFIPYQTLLAVNNVAFLAIYVLYVFFYITDEIEPLSFQFKTIGIIFFTVLAILGITGSLTLYQFEDAYDAANRAEMRYVRTVIAEKRFRELPTHITFIVAAERRKEIAVIFASDVNVDVSQLRQLWEFVPGRIGLSSHRYDFVNAEFLEEGRRYFVRMGGMNFHEYITEISQVRYGIGYSFLHYRQLLHDRVIKMIVILILALCGLLIAVPIVVKMGLLRPFEESLKTASHARTSAVDICVQERNLFNDEKITAQRHPIENERIHLEQGNGMRMDTVLTESTKEKIAQALAYIHENYRFDISREGLASLVSMSPARFGKAFKIYTGKKLGDYINELRIEEAKNSLLTTNKTISEIAFEVGFEQLRSFNRTFYHITGMTPSEYRARTKKY